MLDDRPLWSPCRILWALRYWIWWCGDQGLTFPFWYFLRFEGRPHALNEWLKTHTRAPIWFAKTPWD